MEIIISLNNEKLEHFLETSSRNYYYICAGQEDSGFDQLLHKYNLTELKLDFNDNSVKDNFVESYIDLIGKLSTRYNSAWWWATDTSAKNQFASKLFENLYIFYTISTILKENRDKDIIILNPPGEIIGLIKKYCVKDIDTLKFTANRPLNNLDLLRKFSGPFIGHALFLYSTWKQIYISKKYLKAKFSSELLKNGKYYVLRSWFYDRSINKDNQHEDSFFGALPNFLAKKGLRLLVVAGIIGDYRAIVKKTANHSGYLIIPQEFFLHYLDPVRAIINTHLHGIRVKERVDFLGYDITDLIRAGINSEFRSIAVSRNYLYHYYTKRLLEVVNVDAFTTTYENYPWEKMCFLTIKNQSPQTKVIGYQHNALSKAHLTMRLSKYEKNIIPLPDKINTTGRVTCDFLIKYGNYDSSLLKESCALRFENVYVSTVLPRKTSRKILLTLGGIPSRAKSMVNFAYNALGNQGTYKIIIRPHPALPLKYFVSKLNFDLTLSDSFMVSSNILVKNDLEEVDIVIYDASTIALESLAIGIPVIHVSLNDVVSFDPLFQCTHLKWTVRRENELQQAVEAIYRLPDDEYKMEQAKAREYVREYVHEITDKRLEEFIVK